MKTLYAISIIIIRESQVVRSVLLFFCHLKLLFVICVSPLRLFVNCLIGKEPLLPKSETLSEIWYTICAKQVIVFRRIGAEIVRVAAVPALMAFELICAD